MQPPWRLSGGLKGRHAPHQREWSGQGEALSWPREYAGEIPTQTKFIQVGTSVFSAMPAALENPSLDLGSWAIFGFSSLASRSESAPDGHRTPESAPDGHRTPESAPDGHRTPESAPDGHRTPESAPDGHRTPESAPDGHRTPESAPDGHRTPESAPDGHRTPESAPILSKIQPLVLDQVGGSGTPPETPLFFI